MSKPIALITGASSWIGIGITKKLLKKDFFVFGTYYKNRSRLTTEIPSVLEYSGSIFLENVDFSKPDFSYYSLIEKAINKYGNLNYIINCAAITVPYPFEKENLKRFDMIVNVNLKTPFFLSQAAFKSFKKRKCELKTIINISSIAERYARPNMTIYEMTKAGLSMLTRSLAYQLGKYNIRVNAIAPCGVIGNDINQKESRMSQTESINKIIPIGRYGTMNDIAEVVYFLLSDEAQYINGQTIYADGGISVSLHLE